MNEGLRSVVPAFVQAWNSLFGEYTPVDFKYIDSETQLIVHNLFPDWGYILRCLFFIVVTFCVLRIIGGVLKGGKR